LHIFTFATAFSQVTADSVESFAHSARQYALEHKGRWVRPGRGFHVLIVFACAVSDQVADVALDFAESSRLLRLFGAETRPVVVDVSRGVIATFRRTGYTGGAFAPLLRRKINLYFDGALQVASLPGRPS
jgi:hypothetical protein